jgi:hypothetical protein
MSIAMFRRRPNYYLAEFVTKKLEHSGLKGNILMMGEENGRNVEFLVETFLKKWNNPDYKVCVYDNFDDKFGKDRLATFKSLTADNEQWIERYTSKDFEELLGMDFVLIVFIDFYTAPDVYGYSMSLWDSLAIGGYYYFLNYLDGEGMYMNNLNDHPYEGINRFFREAKGDSSDWAMKPYPYLRKY